MNNSNAVEVTFGGVGLRAGVRYSVSDEILCKASEALSLANINIFVSHDEHSKIKAVYYTKSELSYELLCRLNNAVRSI